MQYLISLPSRRGRNWKTKKLSFLCLVTASWHLIIRRLQGDFFVWNLCQKKLSRSCSYISSLTFLRSLVSVINHPVFSTDFILWSFNWNNSRTHQLRFFRYVTFKYFLKSLEFFFDENKWLEFLSWRINFVVDKLCPQIKSIPSTLD